MSGARLVAALVAILVLTFVVPPLAARQVHQRRLDAARVDAARIAGELAAVGGGIGAGRPLCGPGELPKSAPDVTWLAGVPVAPLPALEHAVGPDPWGNHYIAVVGAPAEGSVIVLSAGPNGIVETTGDDLRATPVRPRGDDVVHPRS